MCVGVCWVCFVSVLCRLGSLTFFFHLNIMMRSSPAFFDKKHLLRWLDAAMGTLESMVRPASWKTVKRLDRSDNLENLMYYGMYVF